jgi:hypothetical protein
VKRSLVYFVLVLNKKLSLNLTKTLESLRIERGLRGPEYLPGRVSSVVVISGMNKGGIKDEGCSYLQRNNR